MAPRVLRLSSHLKREDENGVDFPMSDSRFISSRPSNYHPDDLREVGLDLLLKQAGCKPFLSACQFSPAFTISPHLRSSRKKGWRVLTVPPFSHLAAGNTPDREPILLCGQETR